MTESELKELVTKPLDQNKCVSYKRALQQFFNKNCGCNCNEIYRRLKNNYNNNLKNKNEDEQMNKIGNINQPRSIESGRFVKVIEQQPIVEQPTTSTDKFLKAVKDEIYAGYLYIDRIQKAYKIITGIDNPTSLTVMKKTLLNTPVDNLIENGYPDEDTKARDC